MTTDNEMVAICECGRRMHVAGNGFFGCICDSPRPKKIMHFLKYEKLMEDARDIAAEMQRERTD